MGSLAARQRSNSERFFDFGRPETTSVIWATCPQRRARFGKRIRRWLAAETAARSDTAEPARAARCAAIAAAVDGP
jgi:hypothetical protein